MEDHPTRALDVFDQYHREQTIANDNRSKVYEQPSGIVGYGSTRAGIRPGVLPKAPIDK